MILVNNLKKLYWNNFISMNVVKVKLERIWSWASSMITGGIIYNMLLQKFKKKIDFSLVLLSNIV